MVLEMQADKQVSKALNLAQCDNLISNNLLRRNTSAIMKLLVQVIFLSMMHLVAMVCSTIVMCLLWFLRDVMFCCTISVLYFNQ